jgi:CBS domain-containing protein
MMTTIRDLMHSGLIACSPHTPITEVVGLLRRYRIHGIVVQDDTKRAVGVISDTDLLLGEWLGDTAENVSVLRQMTAAELMSYPAATIDAGTSPADAAGEMRRLHVARLLVTDGSRPVGVISTSDLLSAIPHESSNRSRVRDVMSWGYVACRADTPIKSAVRALLERDSRSLIVLGGDGALAGVVTGFDLIGLLDGAPNGSATVSNFMNVPITIGPDASLREAVDRMLDRSIHRLVVVDRERPGDAPLGLISTTDIMVEMISMGSAWQV